jgi:O-methyltransferase involved in polyketide biosynthesis
MEESLRGALAARAVRARGLLPESPRVSVCAQSALDYSWVNAVDSSNGVFITAEGLLMYLQSQQALGLIAKCANSFPSGQMLFDLPPAWFAVWLRHGMRASWRYKFPPMPFSLSTAQVADLVNTVPGIRAVRDLRPPPGRGRLFNMALSTVYGVDALAPLRGSLTLLEFG